MAVCASLCSRHDRHRPAAFVCSCSQRTPGDRHLRPLLQPLRTRLCRTGLCIGVLDRDSHMKTALMLLKNIFGHALTVRFPEAPPIRPGYRGLVEYEAAN